MTSESIDLDALTPVQQSALETYTSVTGQEPAAAIPLLQRSEWNVQIAITKFFDGEGPDPVAEAQAAAAAAPPRPVRQTQNLMNGPDDIGRRWPPSMRAVEPAPRISTQPEDQPPFRPPFLLALLFSPLNILYRIISSSFRLFGMLFPFLPRFLNRTVNPALQRAQRGTSGGRRPLGPKDTAARFIREFEEEYGTQEVPFLENGYNMALEKAHRELKFLLVVLLAPEHDDTASWVRGTLLAPEAIDFLKDAQNNILVWGGNVQDSEAYQVSNSVRCTKFPFSTLVVHTPNVSSSAMSIVTRISGSSSPTELIEKLRTAINQNREPLDRVRATRAEQQASRTLRQEQDSAYERSLAQDRERARQRREAEAARQRAEQDAAEQQAAAEKKACDLEQWRKWRVQSLSQEPGTEDKDAVRISIRLPSGERVVRKFAGHLDIEELYAFVECYDLLNESEETAAERTTVPRPEGFEHKYEFHLVSPMPRAVYEVEAGGTIKERIGRGGNLLVEAIDDEDDEEASDVES